MKHYFNKLSVLLLLASLLPTSMRAQFVRSTYFMDNVSFRQQLNPALTPQTGFINLPTIGSFNAAISSNSVGMKDVADIIDNSSDADYFRDQSFINALKNNNNINLNIATDMVSLGWYKGKGFWTVNYGLRLDAGFDIPKSIFQFFHDVHGATDPIQWFDFNRSFGGERLNINAYKETGLGYAYPLNDKLTIGAKAKILLGIANLRFTVDKLNVGTRMNGVDIHQDWSKLTNEDLKHITGDAFVEADAKLEATMSGYELIDGNNGIVSKMERGTFGVSGMGLGFDLGAAYKLTPQLTLSAALLDLGFISWGGGNSYSASSNTRRDYHFTPHNLTEAIEFRDMMASGELFNFDMLQVKQEKGTARTTGLYTTMVFGGEYKLLNDKLSLGLLSTTRFLQPSTVTELTLSSGYQVSKMLGFSLTYSMIQSGGTGFGLGMKLGPLVVATDYLYFGNSTRCVNALLGISIPLGGRKKS